MGLFCDMAILVLGIAYLLHAEPLPGGYMGGGGGADTVTPTLIDDIDCKADTSKRKTCFVTNETENVTVAVGHTAVLLCKIKNLGNRTVSWMRKRDLHILTSMTSLYTGDARFSVTGNAKNQEDWNLQITFTTPRDEGIYECQVNTEPEIHQAIYLKVLDVQANITGPDEVYVKKGSTISLTCTIDSQGVPPSNVTWYHAGVIIDFDGPRGGVSLETEKSKNGTTSKLLITRASIRDSGNYSCISSKAAPANVVVHVLNGEHPAAMQHGGTNKTNLRIVYVILTIVLDTLLR